MKRTTLIIISLFVVLAIVIPSLIVLPFSGHQDSTVEKVFAKGNKTATVKRDPSLAVPVMRHATKKIDQIQLRDYLIGVVASEMPADFKMEALKAQALAARTYIAKFLITAGADSSVSDTPLDQVYESKAELKNAWGTQYNTKIKKIEKAVDSTAGEVITYNGQLISPSFFSTSNGYTENAEAYWSNPSPYLKSVKCPWDVNSPKYKTTVTMPVSTVEQKLHVTISSKNGMVGTVLSLTPGKRVEKFKVGGMVFTGREIREKLGLRSADFAMIRQGDQISITTKGYGHGVGMSQYGANGMAEKGKTYKEIITYFYKGVSITNLSHFSKELAMK